MESWGAILSPVLLLLLGAVGYVIRRILEGRHETEKARAILDWVEVHKALYGSAPSLDQVKATREAFLRRNAALDDSRPEEITAAAEKERPEPPPEWMFFGYELTEWERDQAAKGKGIWTQLELNERSKRSFDLVETHLAAEIIRWSGLLRPDEEAYFEQAQAAWRNFRDFQATFSASQYKGGTIAPMIYWGEMFEKTQRRLADLERERRVREQQ